MPSWITIPAVGMIRFLINPSVVLLTSLQHGLSCHFTFTWVISRLMSVSLPKLENLWRQRSFVVLLTIVSQCLAWVGLIYESLGRLCNLRDLFYLMIIVTKITEMIVTVIIIMAVAIDQVLTTCQALFYVVYVYFIFQRWPPQYILSCTFFLHCVTDILPIEWWSMSPSLEPQVDTCDCLDQ